MRMVNRVWEYNSNSSPQASNLARDMAKTVRSAMEKRYECKYPWSEAEDGFRWRLESLADLGYTNWNGARVLDLGCGSTIPMDGKFYPWFCRALKELGADVTGFDLGDNSREAFDSKKIDLMQRGCLDYLPANSVDLATAFNLFDSPTLVDRFGGWDARGIIADKLMVNLKPQLERVIKPEGAFVYDSYYGRMDE